ncbi:GNAT family N-acetyltransferase [Phyllobacterium myrsinacearum]|uniref:Putative acetyltransferase n=1 Tax=Phyllobacterium myrsinacearum TaxID=28101 RepID=A0A839EP65_9HYPH|nr:GNAT family N-acetyltransferase [Phyllobacterium myrsinacearum]MBA8878450.1 putative acetyltransferase [Phyllobacterium myrsinacearum]
MTDQNSPSSQDSGFSIRAARIDDCDQINALTNLPGFRAGTLRLPFQGPEQTRKWLENPGAGTISIVAEIDEKVVGHAGLHPSGGRRAHAANLGLGVHDDFTGRGIGKALLLALIDTADNWLNIRRLELTVYTDNIRAIDLYEKCGFEREGLHRDYAFKGGQFVDALAMARLRKI